MDADESRVRQDRALCGQYARHIRAAHPSAEWAELEPTLQRMWKRDPHAIRWEVAKVVIRFIWALAPILPDSVATRLDTSHNEHRR